MITFDPVLDADALINAPAEEKLAIAQAYQAHCDPTNAQATRDAGARMFYRFLLQYVSTDASPN